MMTPTKQSSSPGAALVEIINYTDPYCTWCWGSEPILGKILETYGDQVSISHRMGGLVEDIDSFFDGANNIGGSGWHHQVAEHWLDASGRHGMPVDEQIFYDIKDEWRGTYPASIAFAAARLQGEAAGNRYLRGLRAAAAAERRPIHRVEVQRELAAELGLDVERFGQDLDSGDAQRAFKADLQDCRAKGVRGFPSFLVKSADGREAMQHGYTPFERFDALLRDVAGGSLKKRALTLERDAILDTIDRVGQAAPREFEEIFDASATEVEQQLAELVSAEVLSVKKAGNGKLYTRR